jgi:hypothetical protein
MTTPAGGEIRVTPSSRAVAAATARATRLSNGLGTIRSDHNSSATTATSSAAAAWRVIAHSCAPL